MILVLLDLWGDVSVVELGGWTEDDGCCGDE